MSRLYSAILDEIERADYQVHSRRARVSFARKLWLTVRS
jgi:phytoene/squalene synthetase